MLKPQVAGMLIRDHRLLLCLRSATRSYYPGVWDLPGGHVEPGESDAAALRRELREELGIDMPADPGAPHARIVDAEAGFDLKLWRVGSWRGEPENRCPAEHDRVGWFSSGDIAGLALALPAYAEIFRGVLAHAD